MRALMQLREGTGEEVFFFILEKSPHFTAIFPTGRAVIPSNASRLIAANRPRTNQSSFLIDSFVKCSRARGVN